MTAACTPVVCQNGHYICMVTREVHTGDMPNQWARAFGKWSQEAPQIGAPLPIRCARCGEPVIADGPGRWLRSYDGWQ